MTSGMRGRGGGRRAGWGLFRSNDVEADGSASGIESIKDFRNLILYNIGQRNHNKEFMIGLMRKRSRGHLNSRFPSQATIIFAMI